MNIHIKIISFLKGYNKNFDKQNEILIFKLTLVLLLLDGSSGWDSKIILRILCTLMLVFTNYLGNKIFWSIIAIFLVFSNNLQFYNIDNHKILFMYWTLLLTLYLLTKEDYNYIMKNAKILIGLVMFFAVFQKFSHGFLEPGFLHGRFLFDGRFILISHFITDIPVEELYFNKDCLSIVNKLPIEGCCKRLSSSNLLSSCTYYFQLFGLFFEFLISIFFLFSSNKKSCKDYLLILFCIGTFFIFPVIGFSSILLLLGIAQTNQTNIRFYYVFTFVIIQFIKIPWQDIIYYLTNS
jgi:hypothetical protein